MPRRAAPRRSSPPYMLLSSLDHPGRGLYRLAAHMRRRARRPGIALSAALSRAILNRQRQRIGAAGWLEAAATVAPRTAHSLCSRSLRPSSTGEGECAHERAATATLRVSSAECQPYPDQTTSDTVNCICFFQLSYFL